LKRWLKRIGIAIVALILAVTLASVAYNLVSSQPTEPATALYPGPFIRLDGSLHAYRRWGTRGTPVVMVGGCGAFIAGIIGCLVGLAMSLVDGVILQAAAWLTRPYLQGAPAAA